MEWPPLDVGWLVVWPPLEVVQAFPVVIFGPCLEVVQADPEGSCRVWKACHNSPSREYLIWRSGIPRRC